MKISLFRLILSVVILVTYIAAFGLLGIGMASHGISIPDAKQVAVSIAPLFSGYITAILGYYFTRGKTGRNFTVPAIIAWVVLIGAALACISVPVLLRENFLNAGPLALLPNLLAVLGIVQIVIGVFVGVVMTLIINESKAAS